MSNHVTKATAIMLKENGYRGECTGYYRYTEDNIFYLLRPEDHNEFSRYSAPTISEAIEWMREVKGLHVIVAPPTNAISDKWAFDVHWFNGKYWELIATKDGFDTHDLAAEAGLIAGLECLGKEGEKV